MDKKLFRQQLEQLAEIKDRKPPRGPNHRPVIEYITEVDEDGEEYQVPVEVKENPTLGFDLIKVKDHVAICELGCGDIVTNQRIERRYCETPQPHWRTKCANCGCFVSPDGVGFIEGGHAIQSAYMRHFNGQKVKPNPKDLEPRFSNESAGYDINGREYIETVTNDNIIRRYK